MEQAINWMVRTCTERRQDSIELSIRAWIGLREAKLPRLLVSRPKVVLAWSDPKRPVEE
jgi:hypothetical protein